MSTTGPFETFTILAKAKKLQLGQEKLLKNCELQQQPQVCAALETKLLPFFFT